MTEEKLKVLIKKTMIWRRSKKKSPASTWKKGCAPSLPWLVPSGERFYVSYNTDREPLGYSPSDEEFYRLRLFNKEEDGAQYIGSSRGWAILLNNVTRDKKGKKKKNCKVFVEKEELDVYLMNPVSRRRIRLPRVIQNIGYWEYPTLAMSSNPTEKNCLVTVVVGGRHILVCRVGDPYWTALPSDSVLPPNLMVDSAVYCRGRFYYNIRGHTNLIVVNAMTFAVEYVELDEKQLAIEGNQWDSYMLESDSELLLVVDVWKYNDGLHVFKADLDSNSWVEVTRLSDNRVLFLSSRNGYCFSLPATEVGCSRGNFIYLAPWDRLGGRCNRQNVWVSFDMQTRKVVKKAVDANNKELIASGKFGLHWFMPNSG